MRQTAIKLEGVWVNFNSAVILEDVSLTIEAGRYVGILGPNGAGKSTLLKVILGLIRPQRGSVRVFGESPESLRHPAVIGARAQQGAKVHADVVNISPIDPMAK